jgi:hypothetical protein
MSKLVLTNIHAEIVDVSTCEEPEAIIAQWIIEYKIYHSGGHFWRGFLHWQKRDLIVDDVIAAIKKDLPK